MTELMKKINKKLEYKNSGTKDIMKDCNKTIINLFNLFLCSIQKFWFEFHYQKRLYKG
jgi:hypothetical protein